MTGFEIAAVIAMLAGAAATYKANQDAAQRQQREVMASLARQRDLQMQAEDKAKKTAEQFAPEDRKQEQTQIADKLTEEFNAPVQSAQQINNAQSTTQGNVSSDYVAAKAASNLNQMKQAESLARLLGKTTAASRLRTNEAIRVADAAAGIDRLGSFSRGQAAADEIGINAAGRPDAGLILGGQVVGALGAGGLAMAGGAANAGTAAQYGTTAGSQQTAMLAAQDAGIAGSSGFSPVWAGTVGKLFKGVSR
ncbi:hypothetical protein [Ensifer sp. SSB1]|jgi:NADH dehydrogenase/NADH:ubiquinone oxidoreductase subunit G|uniref:hypothetical protein n=1 Tax=Ensifer sp. SSB1 TaxID=2795385 RepID=UPI001A3D6A1F|nr:hypothetical protein [Ensifer sp. SSB1]MBK5570093.1 hypothetical protein [Ensifer sp. SSB1]